MDMLLLNSGISDITLGYTVWLQCATSRTVCGSIPRGVTGIFSVATDRTICPGIDLAFKNEY
jgi:hypothetical protein